MKFKKLFTKVLFEERLEFLEKKSNIKFCLEFKEGKIPHLHFYTKDKKIDGAIKLEVAEYFPHGKPIKYISVCPQKALEKFNEWIHNDNNYINLCMNWNNNVKDGNKIYIPKDEYELQTRIPNYSNTIMPRY